MSRMSELAIEVQNQELAHFDFDCEYQQQLEQERWKQTLEAMESAAQGKLVDASEVHSWLNSWGTENEQDAPRSGK